MCCFVTNKSVFFILFHYPRVGRFESSEFLKSYSMSKISDKIKDGQLAKRLVYSNEFDLFTYRIRNKYRSIISIYRVENRYRTQ